MHDKAQCTNFPLPFLNPVTLEFYTVIIYSNPSREAEHVF